MGCRSGGSSRLSRHRSPGRQGRAWQLRRPCAWCMHKCRRSKCASIGGLLVATARHTHGLARSINLLACTAILHASASMHALPPWTDMLGAVIWMCLVVWTSVRSDPFQTGTSCLVAWLSSRAWLRQATLDSVVWPDRNADHMLRWPASPVLALVKPC
jgi:hypothetical protein